MGYTIPKNINEQTRMLVQAGVAQILMKALPNMRASARGAKLPECQFWCEWTYDDGERIGRIPMLQAVVKYPSPERGGFSGCGIIVEIEGGVVAGYTSDQIAVMKQLAGPRPR